MSCSIRGVTRGVVGTLSSVVWLGGIRGITSGLVVRLRSDRVIPLSLVKEICREVKGIYKESVRCTAIGLSWTCSKVGVSNVQKGVSKGVFCALGVVDV